MKLICLDGKKYGNLTVVKRHEINNKYNKPRWLCKCDCGNTTIVDGDKLKNGNTKSCGCLKLQAAINNGKKSKHGMKGTRIYEIWHGIKARCYNPNNKDFKNYVQKCTCNELEVVIFPL